MAILPTGVDTILEHVISEAHALFKIHGETFGEQRNFGMYDP